MTLWKKQSPALEHREQTGDEIVCQYFLEGSRVYTTFPDVHSYAKFILTENNTANELLYGAVHTFFDIDCKVTLSELGFSSVPEFVTKFTDFLIRGFGKHLDTDVPARNFLWSSSTRPGKVSFHITVLTENKFWSTENKSVDLRKFVKILEQETLNEKGFYYLEEKNDEISMHSVLDASIYTKNRCLRSLGARKPDSEVRFKPMKDGSLIPVTERLIRKHSVTIPKSEIPDREEFKLKTKVLQKKNSPFKRSLLEKYAAEYQCEVVSVSGSLVKLRNAEKCRVCPINKEENFSDCAFFIRKNHCLFYGCFNAECTGRLHKVHEFESRFKFYEDYQSIIDMPKTERARSLIEEYLISTLSFVDQPDNDFFVTNSMRPVTGFKKLEARHTVCSPNLFYRNTDISVEVAGDKLKFSDVLRCLVQQRKIRTYNSVTWKPFIEKYPVILQKNKLNIFSGFVLDDSRIKTNVDFTKTTLYDLLHRLTNFDTECFSYFCRFLALRIQQPSFKPSIALCFLNSCPGVGKGTLVEFFKKLWACGKTTVVSFNKLSQFTSVFNSELEFCIWCVLEELSCKNKGSLREFSGLLKDMTSTNSLLLERKSENRRACDFHGTLMLFSNEIRCLNLSRNDRRCFIVESNSDKANKKEYFKKCYGELEDLKILRSAFLFFQNIDLTGFDYRLFPKTELRSQVQNCSDNIEHKFYKHLFKEVYVGQYSYQFNERELFHHWKEFCDDYGCIYRRDRGWVTSTFESSFQPEKNEHDFYSITQTELTKKLRAIFPNDFKEKEKDAKVQRQ